MEITVPPFNDIDEEGNYIGNDYNLMIKSELSKIVKKELSKEEVLKIIHEKEEFDIYARALNSAIYFLNNEEWKNLINKLNWIESKFDLDTIIIFEGLIFKKIK